MKFIKFLPLYENLSSFMKLTIKELITKHSKANAVDKEKIEHEIREILDPSPIEMDHTWHQAVS